MIEIGLAGKRAQARRRSRHALAGAGHGMWLPPQGGGEGACAGQETPVPRPGGRGYGMWLPPQGGGLGGAPRACACGYSMHRRRMRDEESPPEDRDHLPRLGPGAYRGRAIVHWTLPRGPRGQGWLDDVFHTRFRWLLLHGCARHEVACPVYCLMPDHAHLLVAGWTQAADQRLFMPWLRKHTNLLLKARGQV